MKKIVYLLFASLALITLTFQHPTFNNHDSVIYALSSISTEDETVTDETTNEDENGDSQDEVDDSEEAPLPPEGSDDTQDEEDKEVVIPPTPPSTFNPDSAVKENSSDQVEIETSSASENTTDETIQASNSTDSSTYEETLSENRGGKAKERSVEPGRIVPLPNPAVSQRLTLINLIDWAQGNSQIIQRYYLFPTCIFKNLFTGSTIENSRVCSPAIIETFVLNFLEKSLQTLADTL